MWTFADKAGLAVLFCVLVCAVVAVMLTKWRASEKGLATLVAVVASVLAATVLVPPIYAQTWGILKAKELRVIDTSSAFMELVQADGDASDVSWTLTSGNEFTFYTNTTTVSADVKFKCGFGTWMTMLVPGNEGACRPRWDHGFELAQAAVMIVAAGTDALTIQNSSDSNAVNYQVTGNGDTFWGVSGTLGDVKLYRSAADTLKTDDAFHVAGLLVPLANGGTDPAATCTPFEVYADTDGSTTNTNCTGGSAGVKRLCVCFATDTWTGL